MGARNAAVLHEILETTEDPLLSSYFRSCSAMNITDPSAATTMLAPYFEQISGAASVEALM